MKELKLWLWGVLFLVLFVGCLVWYGLALLKEQFYERPTA